MSQVEQIARGLTKAQRAALMRFSDGPAKRPRWGAGPYARINQQGLIAWADWRDDAETITPLGLRVRQWLMENDNGGDHG